MTKTEIKKWFTSFLHKNDATNKLKCWFEMENPDTVGLSSLEIPHIDLLWLENGNVFYHIDHTEDSHLLGELDIHNTILLMQELSNN
jgi:hypothetical protein